MPRELKYSFLCYTKKYAIEPDYCDIGCELTSDVISTFRSSLLGNDVLSCFDTVVDRITNTVSFTRTADLTVHNNIHTDRQMSELTRENKKVSDMNLFNRKVG